MDRDELLAVLEWYQTAGVDIAVGDQPVDRFNERAPGRRASVAPAPPLGATAEPVAPLQLIADPEEARALAARAGSLDELRAIVESYDGCGLKQRATQLVFADGNPQAEIMLIGEAPGGEEDLVGKPFVGRAGQLLDRMLGSIGLDRSRVYIANTVPWRPPGNRNPSPAEIVQMTPFLVRQVELVAPKVIVTLGAVASQNLCGSTAGITRLRGQWRELRVGACSAWALPMLHPAYLLRQPAQKALAWRDLLSLQRKIGELGLQPPEF